MKRLLAIGFSFAMLLACGCPGAGSGEVDPRPTVDMDTLMPDNTSNQAKAPPA